ncbi:MAG: hypothetical protein ACXW2G_05955 [Burkholderiaceae bacterium]
MAQDKQNPGAGGKGTAGKVQGEGDYDAARRYGEKLRDHVQHHDVEKEARDAEPSSEGEEREMEQAEEQGKRRAKEEDPLLKHPENVEADTGKSGGGSGRK